MPPLPLPTPLRTFPPTRLYPNYEPRHVWWRGGAGWVGLGCCTSGHPVGVHHTLVASDPDKPIKWYCIGEAQNCSRSHCCLLCGCGTICVLNRGSCLIVRAAMNTHLTDPAKPYLQVARLPRWCWLRRCLASHAIECAIFDHRRYYHFAQRFKVCSFMWSLVYLWWRRSSSVLLHVLLCSCSSPSSPRRFPRRRKSHRLLRHRQPSCKHACARLHQLWWTRTMAWFCLEVAIVVRKNREKNDISTPSGCYMWVS